MTATDTTAANRFGWLLNSFVTDTSGVTDAVAVSTDGLLISMSNSLDLTAAERVAAMISGFMSLGQGAAYTFDFGELSQIIVAMDGGYLFVSAISGGSCLGVVADHTCDIGLVGHHTRILVERVGTVLTPALIAELRDRVLA